MPRIVNALLWLWWRSFLGVAISTLTILPKKVANTSIMDTCHSTALGLHKMQHPKSLTVCWHTVDAVSTLCWCSVDAHFQVQQHQHWRYCLERQPILRLCVNAIALPLDYTRCNTRICWRSVDAHFQSGAVTMLLCYLSIKAAKSSIMGICRSIALGLN